MLVSMRGESAVYEVWSPVVSVDVWACAYMYVVSLQSTTLPLYRWTTTADMRFCDGCVRGHGGRAYGRRRRL